MDYLSRNLRILVTGGFGFIGGNLIKRLNQLEVDSIFNLDNLTYASSFIFKNHSEIDFNQRHLHFDLCIRNEVKKAMEIADPDLIFHLGAETHVDRSIDSPENFVNTNIIGTFNLLEESRVHWNNLSTKRKNNFKLIHISTDEVFGDVKWPDYANEESVYKPNSPYSASKASSDHLVRAWHMTYKLPTLITNCSNNYGPFQFPEKFIPKAIINIINGKKVPLYGNVQQIRDWIFVNDHIEGLIKCAKFGIPGKRYCLGGNQEISNFELVKEIIDILKIYLPLNQSYDNLISYVEDRPGHDFRYGLDNNLIKKDLNWSPSFDLKKGLDLTIKWYLSNSDWIDQIYKSGYEDKRLGLNNDKGNY